jgi:hypothetical protein
VSTSGGGPSESSSSTCGFDLTGAGLADGAAGLVAADVFAVAGLAMLVCGVGFDAAAVVAGFFAAALDLLDGASFSESVSTSGGGPSESSSDGTEGFDGFAAGLAEA